MAHNVNDEDRPVFFASCTLTDTQKRYPQLHREALAIIFGVKKFHKYIAGKKFTIISDHQPLREIFNESKAIPIANERLQKWAIFLTSYNYTIQYRKGSKLANADALSRLPLTEENDIVHLNINTISCVKPVDMTIIAKETKRDAILSKIYQFIMSKWPENRTGIIKEYFHKKLMLSVEDECIFFGRRIVIPHSLQDYVLEKLHDTHIGITRMKLLAKENVWWLNIENDIETYAKSCTACQLNQSTGSPVKLIKWPETHYFFERIHIDFCHYGNSNFLIIVDTFSRWIDAKIMHGTTCAKVIEVLRTIFAYFGLPKTLVADNGPPFNSMEFKKFCTQNSIKYLNSPPYHPQSNGWAECAVRNTKNCLKKMCTDAKTKHLPMQIKIDNFLSKYRNTPVTTTGKSPNELLFIFRTRTVVSILSNNKQEEKTLSAPKHEQATTKERREPAFKPKQSILYRNIGNTAIKWQRGTIIEQMSKNIYKIKTASGRIRMCHGDQLRIFVEKETTASALIITTNKNELQPIPKFVEIVGEQISVENTNKESVNDFPIFETLTIDDEENENIDSDGDYTTLSSESCEETTQIATPRRQLRNMERKNYAETKLRKKKRKRKTARKSN